MKYTGIIMTGDHPRKILDGTKTMTRRVIKPQPIDIITDKSRKDRFVTRQLKGKRCWCAKYGDDPIRGRMIYCPYGQVGDRLWVRETFVLECPADNKPTDRPFKNDIDWGLILPHYRATEPDIELVTEDQEDNVTKWHPSIYMPRWASRITLEITEVRVERLQEISLYDIEQEGIQWNIDYNRMARKPPSGFRSDFYNLWDSLNAKSGYSCEVNPFVWCISFKLVSNGQ